MVVGLTDGAGDPAEVINGLWAERQKPKLSEEVTQPAQNHALGLPPTLPVSCRQGLSANYRELVGPTTEAPGRLPLRVVRRRGRSSLGALIYQHLGKLVVSLQIQPEPCGYLWHDILKPGRCTWHPQ
jgi:hypothetical protein